MSRKITDPIVQLTKSIDSMTHGDLTKEIPIDQKHKDNEIGVLAQSFQALLVTMRLGNQSYYRGDIYLAYKNYAAALELFKTTNNLKGQGICWNNLGNIFRTWGEFDKAREAYDNSINIAEELNDLGGISPRINNRGLLYLSEENLEQAKEDIERALKIDTEMQSNDRIAIRNRNLGVLYLIKNDLKNSEKYLKKAMKIDQEIEIESELAEDYFQLGRLALKKDDPDEAEQYLKKSLKIAEDYENLPLMRNILRTMVDLYDEQDKTAALHKAEARLGKINDILVHEKDVIFVIDQSGSMKEQKKMRSARKGSKEVFDSIINPKDRIAIIGFHSEIETILSLTQKQGNVEKIQRIFKDLDNTPYQTRFYDAVGLAVDKLRKSPKESQKWIVALTDGMDNLSTRFTPRTLADYIQGSDFPLNLILIGVGRELREVSSDMNLIVNASIRGKYIPIYSEVNVAKNIDKAFKRVREIMASSEIEGFTPEEK